jgi:uncharacterized protein YciI
MADMSAEERGLMQAHSNYWRQQMEKGKVVIFGPVLDSAGPYGIGVIRLEDGIDPATVWADDPIVKARIGFKVTVSMMATAVVP